MKNNFIYIFPKKTQFSEHVWASREGHACPDGPPLGEGDPEGRSSQKIRCCLLLLFIKNVLDDSFRRSLLTRSLVLFSLFRIMVVIAEKCCMLTISMPTKPVDGILGLVGHMLAANSVHHQ